MKKISPDKFFISDFKTFSPVLSGNEIQTSSPEGLEKLCFKNFAKIPRGYS